MRRAAPPLAALAVLVLAGLGANAFWGLAGTVTLAAGDIATTAPRRMGGREAPLGFTLLHERRVDSVSGIEVQVDIRDRDGLSLGSLALGTSRPEATLAASGLALQFVRYDDLYEDLLLRASLSGRTRPLVFSSRSGGPRSARVDELTVVLVGVHRSPGPTAARSRVAILENGEIACEGWLGQGEQLRWRGVRLTMTGWGEQPDGRRTIDILLEKRPGTPLLWLGVIAFLVALAAGTHAGGSARARAEGPPRRNRWLFPAITALLALLLLEGGARLLELGRDLLERRQNPFVDMRNPAPVFEAAEEDGTQIYRRTGYHRLILDDQRFLRHKPERGYRVFLLGGSAAAGYPYERGNYNIARFLERKLSRLLPTHRVEVVNVAGGTYGSHRERAVCDEIINYQPDLILLYTGNNEFLENIVYRRPLPPHPWDSSALLRLGWDLASRLRSSKPSFDVENFAIADQTSNRIAYAFGRSSLYRRDPRQLAALLAHFRYNVTRIVQTAKARGVPILLLNSPVNLKDWAPNASRHRDGLPAAELAQWQEAFRRGCLGIEQRSFVEASAALGMAAAIDPEHAETHFRSGIALLALGERRPAREAFLRALEHDAHPFRALPQMQEILRSVATGEGSPLVDIVGVLDKNAADGISGLDVMLDYVHPTQESQEAIAQEVVRTLAATGLLPTPPALPVESVREAGPYDFEPAIEVEAMETLYIQYVIMRQYDKLEGIYRRYLEALNRAQATRPEMAQRLGRARGAFEHSQPILGRYARLLRAEKLGLLEAEFSREEAQKTYGAYVELIRKMEAGTLSRKAFLEQVPELTYGPAPAGSPASP